MPSDFKQDLRNGTKARQARKEAAKAKRDSIKKSKRKPIKNVSTNNTYTDSDGNTWTSAQVEAKIRAAKTAKNKSGINYCETCGTSNDILDMSHLISVKEAKESGRVELCWDIINILIQCRNTCHKEVESMSKNERQGLYNYYKSLG